MSTNEHLQAIRDGIEGLIVAHVAPEDIHNAEQWEAVIRGHAEALAAEVQREFEIGSSYHERWVRAKIELEAERARVARFVDLVRLTGRLYNINADAVEGMIATAMEPESEEATR